MLLAQNLPGAAQPAAGFQMTTPLWIGFGFLAALLLFLVISFFLTPTLTNDQRRTIKFLTALCAGFAGGFLTGSSLFDAHWTNASANIGISGTAGFAIFFAVFFTYNRLFSKSSASEDNGLRMDIPQGWSFQQVVDTICGKDEAGSQYDGFKPEEKNAILRNQAVKGESYLDLLAALRSITVNQPIRPYSVKKQGSLYILSVK